MDAQCLQSVDCERLLGPGHACGSDGVCSAVGTQSGVLIEALPPRWACVHEPPPPITRERDRTVELRLRLYDYVTGEPVSGVKVHTCSSGDLRCARRMTEDISANRSGVVNLELPQGFDGYFEFDSDQMMPMLMADGPITADTTARVPMLTLAELSAAAKQGGETYDPERAFVVLDVFDCTGEPAAGVRVASISAPENSPFYFNGSEPTRALGATLVSELGQPPEPTALAGFINVPPGIIEFQVSLEKGDQPVTHITLQARAGTMTLMRFRPGGS